MVTPLAKVDPVCMACKGSHGFVLAKLPGGGPFTAICKGCREHNDAEALGFDLRDLVDLGPFEERYHEMAKAKEKSPLEQLAERVKAGTEKRDVERGPRFRFPHAKLRAILKRIGLKDSAVEKEAGLHAGRLAPAKKGEDVRLSTAIKLAKACGTTVEDLFGEPVEVNPEAPVETYKPPVAGNESEAADLPFDSVPEEKDPE